MDKNHKETTQTTQIDANRRRLTKAGLAVPAVLGTLASRQVLGQTPFNCTKSGQVSGNASTHGPDQSCANLGKNVAYWQANFTDTTTLFTGRGFSDVYWIDQKNDNNGDGPSSAQNNDGKKRAYLIAKPTTSNNFQRPATAREVLMAGTVGGPIIFVSDVPGETSSGSAPPRNVPLGQAAIASYLNVLNFRPGYPLVQSDVRDMFNTAIAGGFYTPANWVRASVTWNDTDVLCYFRLLYGDVSSCAALSI